MCDSPVSTRLSSPPPLPPAPEADPARVRPRLWLEARSTAIPSTASTSTARSTWSRPTSGTASRPSASASTRPRSPLPRRISRCPRPGPPVPPFLSIYKGCHWGNCTDRSGLPALASSLPAVPSHWTVTSTASGAYDIAYDSMVERYGDRERAAQRDRAHEFGSTTQEASSRRAPGLLPSQSAGRCGTSGRGRCRVGHTSRTCGRRPWTGRSRPPRVRSGRAHAGATINPAWYLIDVEAGFEISAGRIGPGDTLVQRGRRRRLGAIRRG